MNASNNCNYINYRRRGKYFIPVGPGDWKIAIFLLFLTGSEFVYAAGPVRAPNEIISAANILNLVSGLIIVVLIFLCVAYFLKRLTGISMMSRGYLKIIDTLHLSNREKIILVKVVDSYIVLGISPGNINSLHVLTEQLPDRVEQAEPGFKTRLQQMLSATKNNQE